MLPQLILVPGLLNDADLWRDQVAGMTEGLGPEALVRQSLIDRPDSRATLRGLHYPVLVLCGDPDALTRPGRHLRRRPLTPIEQPETVKTALRQWLSR